MRNLQKDNIIVICTIVLCFMLTLTLCMTFSGDKLLDVFAPNNVSSACVYAIVVSGHKDMTLARQNAELIKARGGAGYVINDENIEIVYNVYLDENDANNVLSTLKEKGAYIKKIQIDEGKFNWCDANYKEAVKDALTYYDKCYDSLNNIANSLNKGEIDIEDAKIKIKVLSVQIDEIKSAFYNLTHDVDSSQITEIKLALVTALALIENVKISSSIPQTTSSIRYQLVQLVYCRQALMNVI